MKTLKIGLAALILSAGVFMACDKDDDSASMTVRMTDAPGDYNEVNVDIQAVQVLYAGSDTASGWTTLNTNSGVYNLLEYQNGVTVEIASEGDMRTGDIERMRLVLGSNNSVETSDGAEFELITNGATQTGLLLNIDGAIQSSQNTEVVIDFDADKSVIVSGASTYILNPAITVKSVAYSK